MANEIKNEFETYIEQLVDTISKDIFMEDLQKVCNHYIEQLEECKKLYTEHTDKDKKFIEKAENSVNQITSLQESLKEKLDYVNSSIEQLNTNCEDVLQEYSTQVHEINDELRTEFIGKFSDTVKNLQRELVMELNGCNTNIKESLQNTITAENLENYVAKVEESTAKITESLHMLNSGYEEVFNSYTERLGAHGEAVRERFQKIVEQFMQQSVEGFSVSLKDMEKHISSREQVEKMHQDMDLQCKEIKQKQMSYDTKLAQIVKIIEKQERLRLQTERENRQNRKILYLLSVGNMFLISLVFFTILILQPWSDIAIVPIVIFCVLLLGVLVGGVFLKNKMFSTNTKKRDKKEK